MKKKFVSAEKARRRFEEELDAMFVAAEGHPKDAAYWWNRITGNEAHESGGKVVIEVEPEQVEKLLQDMFEENLDIDDLDQIAVYWNLICPSTVEVVLKADGDWGGLMENLEDCE